MAGLPRPLRTVKETGQQWMQDHCPRLAAALAYYTVFAMAPLLVLAIGIAGLVWGSDAARGAVMRQVGALIGPAAAVTVGDALASAQHARAGWAGTLLAVAGFLLGATGVFGELQGALNTIWGVEVRQGGWRHALQTRLLSFSLVAVMGFLLVVSLLLNALWAAAASRLRSHLQGGVLVALGTVADVVVSLLLLTLLLAAIFKVLPDATVQWRDTWAGAFATALLLTLGKDAIGLYLGHSSVTTTFGAAGSLAAILAWLYYAGLALFLGAEYTQVHADHMGRPLVPKVHAFAVQARQRDDVAAGKRKPQPSHPH